MNLLEQIRGDRMAARLGVTTNPTQKLKVRLLTTLVGEAETALKGKQAKKFDMLKLVQKFSANLNESLDIKYTADQHQEWIILQEYLPKQLTESEIKGIILLQVDMNLGKFMGFMTRHYNGQYDGKRASELFKELNS